MIIGIWLHEDLCDNNNLVNEIRDKFALSPYLNDSAIIEDLCDYYNLKYTKSEMCHYWLYPADNIDDGDGRYGLVWEGEIL